jgi:hypothetical protein
MSAGTAWGSPRSRPTPHAAAARTFPIAIPQRLDERGHGRRAYPHQRLRCRSANIPIAIPQRLDERGDGLGVADCAQRLRCRSANITVAIPQCLDERGHGLGVADLRPTPRAAAARTFALRSPSAWMSAGTAWGSPSCAQRPRCRSANSIPIAIPQCFYERGDGLGVADASAAAQQPLRCRTANMPPSKPRTRHPPVLG